MYITDAGGYPPALSEVEVYQYFYYSPFGESLINQKPEDNGAYNSPYRFNAKELDAEPTERSSRTPSKNKTSREQTGNYYYGARYYNPKWSL